MNLPRQSAIRNVPVRKNSALQSGFTMIEIALCLAVIGFALVAIIGVLPIGMNVQKDNREETVINFDANYLMDAIRSGSHGLDNLTNYVISITNVSTLFDANGKPLSGPQLKYYTQTIYFDGRTVHDNSPALTNGEIILGLLSQPKYMYWGNPAGSYFSNYVVADIRSLTGSPLDQGPSLTSRDFAFRYRVTVEVIPSAQFPYQWTQPGSSVANFTAPGFTAQSNVLYTNAWTVAKNLQANLNEIRLRFRWPVLPNGKTGNGNATFRTSFSGAIMKTNSILWPAPPYPSSNYFFLQPQTYTAQ